LSEFGIDVVAIRRIRLETILEFVGDAMHGLGMFFASFTIIFVVSVSIVETIAKHPAFLDEILKR
jgi:hypothetical protein